MKTFNRPFIRLIIMSAVVFIIYSFALSGLESQVKTHDKANAGKRSSLPDSLWRVLLGANDIEYWIANNGDIAHHGDDLLRGGMRWKNHPGWVIWASGFYLGVLKPGSGGATDTVSVSQVEYFTEFQAGRILNHGSVDSLQTENPDSSNVRIYVLPENAAVWPAEAPHDELGYPLKLSAKDTWAVFNDLSPNNSYEPTYCSPKLGIECQRQTFQFLEFPFNNAVLVRMKIINKSDQHYESCYFGLYGDPDVGNMYWNDSIGSDSVLSMVYGFSDSTDQYPYAAGLQLLQSATVPSAASDTAERLDIREQGFYVLRLPDRKNITGTSAMAILKNYNDPGSPRNKYDSTRYLYMKGLDWNGNPKPFGPWDVMVNFGLDDKRCILGSGPFDMASGDTLDIWYALIAAIGTNNRNAVDTLKNYAALIQSRFYADMNSVVVAIQEPVHAAPASFTLYPNYPNPFNPATTIRFDLNRSAKVSLKIYNVLGQEVRTLVSGQMPPGVHSVTWDGKDQRGQNVSSGVYLYRLETGGFSKTLKLTLLK